MSSKFNVYMDENIYFTRRVQDNIQEMVVERERNVREWFMNEDEETKDNSTRILDG